MVSRLRPATVRYSSNFLKQHFKGRKRRRRIKAIHANFRQIQCLRKDSCMNLFNYFVNTSFCQAAVLSRQVCKYLRKILNLPKSITDNWFLMSLCTKHYTASIPAITLQIAAACSARMDWSIPSSGIFSQDILFVWSI